VAEKKGVVDGAMTAGDILSSPETSCTSEIFSSGNCSESVQLAGLDSGLRLFLVQSPNFRGAAPLAEVPTREVPVIEHLDSRGLTARIKMLATPTSAVSIA
jgi:hypothetical protein